MSITIWDLGSTEVCNTVIVFYYQYCCVIKKIKKDSFSFHGLKRRGSGNPEQLAARLIFFPCTRPPGPVPLKPPRIPNGCWCAYIPAFIWLLSYTTGDVIINRKKKNHGNNTDHLTPNRPPIPLKSSSYS